MTPPPWKIAFLSTHPIQYQAPFFRRLSSDPDFDLTVFFCSDHGAKAGLDRNFGVNFQWDIPLLEGYRYRVLPNYSPAPTIFRPATGLLNPGVWNGIARNRFDGVFIHGWNYPTALAAMGASARSGTRFFIRGEAPQLLEVYKNPWKRAFKRRYLHPIFRTASGFLSIGSSNTDFYVDQGVPPRKIFLAPYAVDNDRFIEAARRLKPVRKDIRLKLGIPENHIVILFAGKLIDIKRPVDLFEAFVSASLDRVSLLFVGDGVLRKTLEDRIRAREARNVVLAGFRNQRDMEEMYAAADLFVLPSSFEPWGLVVNEAMCFGLPVVVSDRVGCGPDLAREGVNGHVFPVGDVARLADLLRLLVLDGERRRRMGAESLNIIKHWGYEEGIEAIRNALSQRESTG